MLKAFGFNSLKVTPFQAVGFKYSKCSTLAPLQPGVGEALTTLLFEDGISREDIFLQTKYTPIRGQDPAQVPYDEGAPLAEQVAQSFATSQANLVGAPRPRL